MPRDLDSMAAHIVRYTTAIATAAEITNVIGEVLERIHDRGRRDAIATKDKKLSILVDDDVSRTVDEYTRALHEQENDIRAFIEEYVNRGPKTLQGLEAEMKREADMILRDGWRLLRACLRMRIRS